MIFNTIGNIIKCLNHCNKEIFRQCSLAIMSYQLVLIKRKFMIMRIQRCIENIMDNIETLGGRLGQTTRSPTPSPYSQRLSQTMQKTLRNECFLQQSFYMFSFRYTSKVKHIGVLLFNQCNFHYSLMFSTKLLFQYEINNIKYFYHFL